MLTLYEKSPLPPITKGGILNDFIRLIERKSSYGNVSSGRFWIPSNAKAPPLYLWHCQPIEDGGKAKGRGYHRFGHGKS
jgi:hypothetical protein